MRKAFCIFAGVLALSGVAARAGVYELQAKVGAVGVTNVTATQNISGNIDSVYVQLAAASQTAAVSIVSARAFGSGLPARIIYTNSAVTASVAAWPRFVPTDNTGATNAPVGASAVTEPHLAAGDTVTFSVNQASAGTQILWRAFIVTK